MVPMNLLDRDHSTPHHYGRLGVGSGQAFRFGRVQSAFFGFGQSHPADEELSHS